VFSVVDTLGWITGSRHLVTVPKGSLYRKLEFEPI